MCSFRTVKQISASALSAFIASERNGINKKWQFTDHLLEQLLFFLLVEEKMFMKLVLFV